MRTIIPLLVLLASTGAIAQDPILAEDAYNKATWYLQTQDNYVEAAKWYKIAAENGHSDAQVRLGRMYAKGIGLLQDFSEAARYFRMSADQYNGDAQYELANLYDQGLGIPQSDIEAAKYYRMAADQNVAIAQVALGIFYFEGRGGLPKSNAEALYWLYLGAKTHGPEENDRYRGVLRNVANQCSPADDDRAIALLQERRGIIIN